MTTPLCDTYNPRANPRLFVNAMQIYARDVEKLHNAGKAIAALLNDKNDSVKATSVSDLIDMAEKLRLVNRPGMIVSGHRFVREERELFQKGGFVTAEEAMTAVHHVVLQARRANNILHRKPGAYQACPTGQLYGALAEGWKPLIP